MAANRLTTAQRQELGRQTQRKLRARIAEGSLPQDYYRQLGRRGFRVCLQKHGARQVAAILSAFYGRPITVEVLERNRERAREHAATRRAYPLAGQVCVCCGAPAEHRDHSGPHGWRDGHGAGFVQLLCGRCHRDVEIARIKADD